MFAMAHSTWHIQYISSSLTIISFSALIWISLGTIGTVSAQIEAQPWYESLPAVAMDYKIHLDAGKEDCYYQYVQPGATLYVSFQVSLFWSIRFHTISPDVAVAHTSWVVSNWIAFLFVLHFPRCNRWFVAVTAWPDLRFAIRMVKLWNHTNGNHPPNTLNKHRPVAIMPSVWTISSHASPANWSTSTLQSSNTRNGPNMPKK